MAGREQKAREGKWNGGFAPYGYKLENGNLVIAEDEVEVIRVIYDRYIHTNEGVAGVAKYLNRNGYAGIRRKHKEIRNGYQVETVNSGNSTPRECMANQRSERMDCVGVESSSLSQLSRQWQGAAV